MPRSLGFIDPPVPSDTLETWERYLATLKAYPPNTLGRNSEIKLTKSIIAKMKGRRDDGAR